MGETKENQIPGGTDVAVQHEDVAIKTAMRFFAEELLPYFGIEGKVIGEAPTELIHLDVRKLFEDFNLVMEDGTWKHFEFQSTNEGVEGLKRFRTYEALASYQHKVSVTTYVLYSGRIKNPMTEFTEGANTYRVVPIIMQNEDADGLIVELREKAARGEELTRQDIVPLTLCLLMGGEMSLKDRVKSAYEITAKSTAVPPDDVRKVEAVLYVMADKFLDTMEMDEIMEGICMTRLGQKILDKGKAEGKLEIAKNLLGILDEKIIAEKTGLSLEEVQRLKEGK